MKLKRPLLPEDGLNLKASHLLQILVPIYKETNNRVCRDVWFKETQGTRFCCPLGALALSYEVSWGDGGAAENLWNWTYGRPFTKGFTDGVDPEELFSALIKPNEFELYKKGFQLGCTVSIELLQRIKGE